MINRVKVKVIVTEVTVIMLTVCMLNLFVWSYSKLILS